MTKHNKLFHLFPDKGPSGHISWGLAAVGKRLNNLQLQPCCAGTIEQDRITYFQNPDPAAAVSNGRKRLLQEDKSQSVPKWNQSNGRNDWKPIFVTLWLCNGSNTYNNACLQVCWHYHEQETRALKKVRSARAPWLSTYIYKLKNFLLEAAVCLPVLWLQGWIHFLSMYT